MFIGNGVRPNEQSPSRPWGRRRYGLFAALGVAVAALVAFWVYLPGRPFDPAAWRDDALVGGGARLEMADRLVARRTLVGMTRPEVAELLGEPPATVYFAEWDLVYWLGPGRGCYGLDSEWLVLRLGPDGRVEESRIACD